MLILLSVFVRLFQCQELLDVMGIPHIVASGEAEATCAVLNATGVGIIMIAILNLMVVLALGINNRITKFTSIPITLLCTGINVMSYQIDVMTNV